MEDNTLEIAYRQTTGNEGAPCVSTEDAARYEEVGELWRSRKRARTEDRARKSPAACRSVGEPQEYRMNWENEDGSRSEDDEDTWRLGHSSHSTRIMEAPVQATSTSTEGKGGRGPSERPG
jgi:hypothetical protein